MVEIITIYKAPELRKTNGNSHAVISTKGSSSYNLTVRSVNGKLSPFSPFCPQPVFGNGCGGNRSGGNSNQPEVRSEIRGWLMTAFSAFRLISHKRIFPNAKRT